MAVTADNAPFWLSGRARQVWANAYNDASVKFQNVGGSGGPSYRPGPIAARVVRGLFGGSGRRRLPGPSRMPNPGGLVFLGGPMLALYVATPEGRIVKKAWPSTTKCLWSPKLGTSGVEDGGAVVVFPKDKLPVPIRSARAAPKLLRLYGEWHDGKEPWGLSEMPVQSIPRLGPAQVCVATVYSSDKFSDSGVFTNYIHVHESDGVLARIGPRGVLVRGGKLRLTPGGLAG